MAAPQIKINGGSAGVKASCSASSAVTATLDDTSGVRSVTWSIASTDETTSTASYTLTTSGTVGQNVAFTSLGAGTAGILKAVINGGVNLQTGLSDSANTTATCKFYVPLAAGSYTEVGAAGEKLESDSTFGSTGIINSGARAASAVGSAAVWVDASSAPAVLPSAIPTRALSSTLSVVGNEVEPITFTRRDAAATSVEGIALKRTVTSNAAGAAGQAIELAYYLTDNSPGSRLAGRIRYGWTSPVSLTPRAYCTLSVLTTDGEHDYLTIADSGNVTLNVPSGTARTLLSEGTASSLTIGADIRSSTGANNGVATTFKAGDGQAQSGGSNNNDGGAVVLRSGAAGTGGGGTAGADGNLSLKTGTTDRIVARGDGADITLTATVVKVSAATGIQTDGKYDTLTATALTLGGTNATSIACSGLGLTGVASVANASGALSLSSGSGNASLDADASHVVNVGTSTANGTTVGRSGKTTAVNGGAVTVTASGVLTLEGTSAVSPVYVHDAGGGGIMLEAGGGTLTLRANAGSIVNNLAGTTKLTVATSAITATVPIVVPTYTVGTLPSASPAAQIIYVSDESGGATIAFSDNTNFRRVSDRAIVS